MEIVDFVNKTGKNIGLVQNTKLGFFFETNEKNIRYLRKTKKNMFDSLYLGALCKANNITRDDLIELIKQKNKF